MRTLRMLGLCFSLCLGACLQGTDSDVAREPRAVAQQSQALCEPDAATDAEDASTPVSLPQPALAGAPAPLCSPEGDSCSLRGNVPTSSCCAPSTCVPVACTNSIPPSCFGTCKVTKPKPPVGPKCFSSVQCTPDQICSTELGVCDKPSCAPGRVCPAVCAGTCVPKPTK